MAFAVFALAAGYLLQPLGISKIRATPTWCLYTIAFTVAAFALLYWVCDIRKKAGWALPSALRVPTAWRPFFFRTIGPSSSPCSVYLPW